MPVMTFVALSALLASSVSAALIFPLDRSEILAGQVFDFKVELDTSAERGTAGVTVCGRPAAEVFGRPLEVIASEAGVGLPALLARGVRLSRPGPCLVEVSGPGGPARANWLVYSASGTAKAQRVILLIGDGLSLAHRTAARAMGPGHSAGRANAHLAMDDLPHTALLGTSASDSLLPDSAQTATAYAIGLKTAVESLGVMADRTPDLFDDPRAEGLLALAARKGLARGLVTTASLFDATPAAFYAHTRQRYEKAAIAGEFLKAAPEVALGGGSQDLRPRAVAELHAAGWVVADSSAALAESAVLPGTRRLLGVFAAGDMAGVVERRSGRAPGQPGLVEMLDAALAVLSRDEEGFFLMAEGALIDKFSHQLDWERAVMDTLEFDKAVARAKEFAARDGRTLVLVLADHTQGASVSGMVRMEQPGPDMRERVGTYGWAGYPAYTDADKDGYPDRLDVGRRLAFFFSATPDHFETWGPKLDGPFKPTVALAGGKFGANERYRSVPGAVFREGNIPRALEGGVHSAEDVVLGAYGPGSEAVYGWMENTAVFRIIAEALALGPR